LLSIISPVHKTSAPYLLETYKSLLSNDYTDWQWVLVPNRGGEIPEQIAAAPRVKIVPTHDDEGPVNSIGRLKRFACEQADGDVLIELDADDLLLPWSLRKIAEAFENPATAMVYSNDCEFTDGTWESRAYSSYWGWKSRDFFWQGHALKEMVAWEPSPHMMRQIFWCPDHVRAWRTAAYKEVGGHDPALATGDDHDLAIRFYLRYGAKGLRHIDECLYLYRVHDNNSCRVYNDAVQKQTEANYVKYSRALAIRWANDNGLLKLDLGGAYNAWPDFETVDMRPGVKHQCDLRERWPFEDSTVGVINATDIIEHLPDPIHTMNELYRVLAPGGWAFINVPSTDGRGAWQDPTHVSFWNENSFAYYTDARMARFIQPWYTGRFQNSRVITWFPSEEHRKSNVPYVQADLIALKPPYSDRPVGEVLI